LLAVPQKKSKLELLFSLWSLKALEFLVFPFFTEVIGHYRTQMNPLLQETAHFKSDSLGWTMYSIHTYTPYLVSQESVNYCLLCRPFAMLLKTTTVLSNDFSEKQYTCVYNMILSFWSRFAISFCVCVFGSVRSRF